MRIAEVVYPANRTLYHGTCRAVIPSILRHGLIPQAGKFTTQAYAEDGVNLADLVFAADKEHSVRACVAAMGASIQNHYGIRGQAAYQNYTLYTYGALCVIPQPEPHWKRRDPDDDYGFDQDTYPQVEPNDYYSEQHVFPAYILTGKKLVWWLERQRARFDPTRRAASRDRFARAA